jgi:uncharacterized Zn finger protein (UPF0148 family)
MEMRVQLKICEGCGSLFYRAQTEGTIYCRGCEEKLKDFPSPESRKRRGRRSRPTTLPRVWGVATVVEGVR